MTDHQHGRRVPSPGLIVAAIALVVALAGSAVALPGKGKVDKNDLKKNVVKSKNIAPNAVTADDLADPEPSHRVGDPGEPAYGTGGENDCVWRPSTLADGGPYAPISFFKDADGVVHLAGAAIADDGPGGDQTCDQINDAVIFELPPGYRPQALEPFAASSGSSPILVIGEAGFPELGIPPGGVVVNDFFEGVSGISFRAAGTGGIAAPAAAAGDEPSLREIKRALRLRR